MTPGPMVGPYGHQLQSYYGCSNCGGWGGGGSPGGRGRGYINIPSAPPQDEQQASIPNQLNTSPESDLEHPTGDQKAAQMAAEHAAEIAHQFESTKLAILSQLKGISDTDLDLKDAFSANGFASVDSESSLIKIGPITSVGEKASQLKRGLDNISVPPPITHDLVIGFGQLSPEDEQSKRVFQGLEDGLAWARIFGKINGTALPEADLILIAGKSLVAAEDGADVYLERRNKSCDLSLRYLKSPSRRTAFAQIVCELRNRAQVPEDADPEMVKAAKAIVDPALGNNGVRIAWDAMMSPDARNAALTRACIESESLLAGKAAESLVGTVIRDPPFKKAQEALLKASAALRVAKDPADRAALQAVIGKANEIMRKSYLTESVKELIKQGVEDVFRTHEERSRTVPSDTPP